MGDFEPIRGGIEYQPDQSRGTSSPGFPVVGQIMVRKDLVKIYCRPGFWHTTARPCPSLTAFSEF